MSTVKPDLDPTILSDGGLRVEANEGLVRVILARPEARNAQTPLMWKALASVGTWLMAAEERPNLVVIEGDGPSFSAGLDRRMFTPEGIPGEGSLLELVALSDEDLDARIQEYQRAFTWQRHVPCPTLAVVQGHAIGAGFQLALACDMVIASTTAQFAMRETALGLVPDLGGTKPLVDAVGHSRALEICATGRSVSAAEALALGLVLDVTDDLDRATTQMVQSLAQTPSGAVADLLPLLRGAGERTPAEQRAAERRQQIARLRSLVSGQS